MGLSICTRVPRKKLALLSSAAAASNDAASNDAASNTAAASMLVTPKPRGRPPKKKTKKKQNQQDRDDRRDASLESATINDSPRPGSPIAPSGLALLSPASVSSVASSLNPSNRRKKGEFVMVLTIIIIHQESCFVWLVMN